MRRSRLGDGQSSWKVVNQRIIGTAQKLGCSESLQITRPFITPVAPMSRRSRAREVVLQILYQDDLNPDRRLSDDDEFMRRRLRSDDSLISFAKSLLSGVRRNRLELDPLLAERTENWSIARMAVTDRNVLRLGAFELLYSDTPPRVAIDEAVELARRFGSKHSFQFVNGILDRVLHDLKPEE
jgi:N utilization substance protein B